MIHSSEQATSPWSRLASHLVVARKDSRTAVVATSKLRETREKWKKNTRKAQEEKQKRKSESRQAFFAPRKKQRHDATAVDTALAAPPNDDHQLPPLPPLVLPPPPQLTNDPSVDIPFSTAAVPVIFRESVTAAANEIREWSKAQSTRWNQHGSHRFSSAGCPWTGIEKDWPDPNKANGPVSLKDYLLPRFARVKVFLPDRMMGQHLPQGRMPCKWHGWDNDCVIRDAIYNPQGPRVCHDVDSSVIYLFSGKFRCRIQQDQKAPEGTTENLIFDEDDNNYCCFVGHCPEVLCKLPPNIRSSLGVTVTRKRAFTIALVDSVIDDAAGQMGFKRIQKKLAGAQKRSFYNLKRDFYGVRANPVMQATIYGGVDSTNCDIPFEDVVPYAFPSRQYVQSAFVKRMLDRLPFFERHLQLIGGRILRGDKSYKVVKFIHTATNVEGQTKGRESMKAYDSLYTVMNEYGQIAATYFVRGGDFEEMERVLVALRNRYNVHGLGDIQCFYTDDPTHEYAMLTRSFPELAKDDDNREGMEEYDGVPVLPLPENWERKTIVTYQQLEAFCVSLQHHIDNNHPVEEIVYVGLDVEWDSLTLEERKDRKPATLQLSTHSGEHMCVIQLAPTFSKIIENESFSSSTALKSLLSNSKVVLCGVGVKSDIRLLYMHWEAAHLFGENLDSNKKIFDPNQVARHQLCLISGSGTGTLQALCKKFLHQGRD